MGSSSEYWHYVQQCTALAARTANEDHKQFMLAMAETWRRLATGDFPDCSATTDHVIAHGTSEAGTSPQDTAESEMANACWRQRHAPER